MNTETCDIPGVLLCRPAVHGDARGYFKEISRRNECEAAGMRPVLQTNMSFSKPGVLRGLHYQIRHPQEKLVSVAVGEIFDVVVDCRPSSPAFGKWASFLLSAERGEELYVPAGLAHGFQVVGNSPAAVVYQCDDYYHAGDEGGLNWASPALAIPWPDRDPVLSDKDRALPPFSPDLVFPSFGR